MYKLHLTDGTVVELNGSETVLHVDSKLDPKTVNYLWELAHTEEELAGDDA